MRGRYEYQHAGNKDEKYAESEGSWLWDRCSCRIGSKAIRRWERILFLLGPQVRFNLAKVKEQCPNCPVEAIDMAAYGAMDGAKVIRRVKEVLGDWNRKVLN